MLSCLKKRQNSPLNQQRNLWRSSTSPAFAFTCTRHVSDSSSISSVGGPIKHKQSARQGTPRFCPTASLASVRGLRFPVPHCNLLGFSSFASSQSFPPLPHISRSGLDKALFSTSRAVMGASKIDGTAIAKRIRESLHTEIQDKKKTNPRYIPSLKIIQGASVLNPWLAAYLMPLMCDLLTFMTLLQSG